MTTNLGLVRKPTRCPNHHHLIELVPKLYVCLDREGNVGDIWEWSVDRRALVAAPVRTALDLAAHILDLRRTTSPTKGAALPSPDLRTTSSPQGTTQC